MTGQITRGQIAKIWACAHSLGLDKELLYLLVPRGSISAMTRQEASDLIGHLTELGARRVGSMRLERETDPAEAASSRQEDPNAATREQRNFIYFLLGRLGWLEEPARVRGFLRKFAHVDAVEEIAERRRASAIIEALKAIHKRQRQKSNGQLPTANG